MSLSEIQDFASNYRTLAVMYVGTEVRFYGIEYENKRNPCFGILDVQFQVYSMENSWIELEFD